MKTLKEQLKSAQRELAVRRNVYPKRLLAGSMRQESADHEIECMEAIVETLHRMWVLEADSEEIKRKASELPL